MSATVSLITYAHVVNGVVVSVITPPAGFSITTLFHGHLIWVDCTATIGVRQGWTYLAGVFAAPGSKPSPSIFLTSLQMMALLTAAEDTAIISTALTSAAVLRWLLMVTAADYIDLTNPETIGGVDALVAAGLLTAARGAAILANQPAPAAPS